MKVLTAPPVSVKQPPSKSKPKTAKEAMRARIAKQDAQRRKERGEALPDSRRAADDPPRSARRSGARVAVDEEPESDADVAQPEARPGLWQRIKRWFGR